MFTRVMAVILVIIVIGVIVLLDTAIAITIAMKGSTKLSHRPSGHTTRSLAKTGRGCNPHRTFQHLEAHNDSHSTSTRNRIVVAVVVVVVAAVAVAAAAAIITVPAMIVIFSHDSRG